MSDDSVMRNEWLDVWNKVSGSTRHASEKEKVSRGRNHFRRDSKPRHDPLLDIVLEQLDADNTVIDIGAGNGRWTIPIAGIVKRVTAIEPSNSMIEMLSENIASANRTNITVIQQRWEEIDIEPHDIVTCTHAIYETLDFEKFIRKMGRSAKVRCYLVLRLPPVDGVIGRLSQEMYGHPFDSPNAVIAWNALYLMGIYANVIIEEGMHRWKDSSLEDAFYRAKRHLNAEGSSEYDELIRDTLGKRLELRDGTYFWPDGMRSALLWWDTTSL